MFVVINVDDLGLHPAVRRAVADLAARGMVTSSTLLVNGPDAAEAARLPGVGLGVHLNILRGKPMLDPARIPSLVDEDGLFLGDYARLLRRYLTGRLDHAEVALEWTAQVERALDLGLTPTHFDSEKHIHAWPTLMAVAGDVARSFGVRWMRRPLECLRLARLDSGGLRSAFLGVCSLFQRKPEGLGWPDVAYGIADQGCALRPDRFRAYMRRYGSAALVEIVCHPGLPEAGDPPLPPEYGPMRVAAQWQTEHQALCHPDWPLVFAELGAELVHYGQLP